MMSGNAIPDGFHTVTPHLVVGDVASLVAFLEAAFAAEETYRVELPDGRVTHSRVRIGTSMLMIGRASDEFPAKQAEFYLYVADCDAVYERARAAGAGTVQEPADQSYGDRVACVREAQGNLWWIGTRLEDVSAADYVRRITG